ncbi:MAG: hypothetical protein KJ006_01820 [Thermoleophilia bacterium]|nr:hypothetical protein [Thermoleophilia bacterium]GIK76724.1 MAG: hypothetical protein BroJett022_04140 [Actinomycetes bacterium]
MNGYENDELILSLRQADPAQNSAPGDRQTREAVRRKSLNSLGQGVDADRGLPPTLVRWLAVLAALVALPGAYAVGKSVTDDGVEAEVTTEGGTAAGVIRSKCSEATAAFEEAGIGPKWQPTVYANGCPTPERVDELIHIIRQGRSVVSPGQFPGGS